MDDKAYVTLGSGRAYSSSHCVNVILTHESNREGNHIFPKAKGKVHDAIKARVEQVIREVRANGETLWPAYPNPRITVRWEGNPGEYYWTAWDE